MHSPAVGRIVAELVLEKLPASEFLSFALERFGFREYQRERCLI
jgi:glycine/D-amino acid oxidase-like deaminating enzyme